MDIYRIFAILISGNHGMKFLSLFCYLIVWWVFVIIVKFDEILELLVNICQNELK